MTTPPPRVLLLFTSLLLLAGCAHLSDADFAGIFPEPGTWFCHHQTSMAWRLYTQLRQTAILPARH